MRESFGNIEIGTIFHTGKSKGVGINGNKIMFLLYRKDNKTVATVIDQIGYGNKRCVGDRVKFALGSSVWTTV